MAIYGTQLMEIMNCIAPKQLAMPKDRIGLQVGDPHHVVKGVLVTLDVTESVIDEAITLGVNWIIAHHAVIFQPLKKLRTDTPQGRLLAKALTHGIQIFIAHTNLDVVENGVNDILAGALHLKATQPLDILGYEKLFKLVVTVPMEHHPKLLQTVTNAGAGWIGNYSHCTYNLVGEGTFLPRDGSDPFIGKQGEMERVKEVRLETIVRQGQQNEVLQAMLKAHPYEEPAYDLFPLENKGSAYGIGRVGDLPQMMTLGSLARQVKQKYQVSGVRIVGSVDHPVTKVAIVGGSGARYWQQAQQVGADVLVTGDVDFHTAQDALAAGFSLLDPGHHVEELMVESLKERLTTSLSDEIHVYSSQVDTNPFQFA